ncbi:protein timeless isoform X2 [Episyrphus balteatus]|uniref:protein timeless isoform X2 n=1 Tax=Episyrphus balteatus TaxID=286459 RepID=UPI0024869915|nr:protein timeless isoform X2 [Episyrphus balteatus]
MDWLLASPKIQSAFASLGSIDGGSYVVSPNALSILEEINCKLTYEDQTLRTYRRAIGFGQNIRTDLIPLLENAKDDDVLNSVIRILVNLTVPVECLFSVEVMYRTEVGRTTVFELNNLLYKSKEAFTDPKSTKSVLEYMKHILDSKPKLSPEKCEQINNCLVLLRNILHIPDSDPNLIVPQRQESSGSKTSMQNTILWNLFVQSIDKLLLYLMTCPRRSSWVVTMVQLIALMYKEQHVCTMQKMLNMWFEASLSESSEDNESNTTPPLQKSGDSSPMLTSDPTSDSSDNGSGCKKESPEDRRQALREETDATLQEVSRIGHEYQNALIRVPTKQQMHHQQQSSQQQQQQPTQQPTSSAAPPNQQQPAQLTPSTTMDVTVCDDESQQTFKLPSQKSPAPSSDTSKTKVRHSSQVQLTRGKSSPTKRECASSQSDQSDCGYGTQVENQESISISSNEEYAPHNKPAHQKPPCNSKPRTKHRAILTLLDNKDLRRKKLVKRSKSSLINMKGLFLHTPTSEDISNLLKEFTVDFLLKGYDFVVEDLHMQLLTDVIFMDTSHFFWLLTYFLKFAAQLELDLEHMHSVLTFDVISYLAYEGVILCEQLELNKRNEGTDVKSYLRRIHLLVTAIREFLQAIETYKRITHLSETDRKHLHRLQVQISSAEDIRNLFVLLMRNFNPNIHTKQYLQDLIITNHMLLQILDSMTKTDDNVNVDMIKHISQFATPEIMCNYGMLLEGFTENGEFVNDCIFTMMHHVSGDLSQVGIMFQPVILKTFSRIWETDYELCEDWGDLIEYVINKFIHTPQRSPLILRNSSLTALTKEHNLENTQCAIVLSNGVWVPAVSVLKGVKRLELNNPFGSIWTQEEMNTLYWYYVQGKKTDDVVGNIVQLFRDNGKKQKSRISVIQQLLQQDIIALLEYDDLMKFEDAEYQKSLLLTPTSTSEESGIDSKESSDKPVDDLQVLRDLIIKEQKSELLTWLQNVLLECCYIKLTLQKKSITRKDYDELPHIMEPIAYHCIFKNESIPIVQWNSEQTSTMLYQPFVLLLHKLGFQLPADAGSLFPRIPNFWTVETMFSLAKKLGSLDDLNIKFDVKLIKESAIRSEHLKRSSLTVIHEDPRECLGKRGTPMSDDESKNCEKNGLRDISAFPRPNQANSIIRFTPDPVPSNSVPNWLQLVMRSKCVPSDRSNMGFTLPNKVFVSSLTNTPPMAPPSFPYSKLANLDDETNLSQEQQQNQQQQQQQQQIQQQAQTQEQEQIILAPQKTQPQLTSMNSFSDDDSAMIDESIMKSIQRNDSISSGFHTQRSGSGTLDMDSEYFAMVSSAFMNEQANDDVDSVTSDLTHMNVSDDDDKNDFPLKVLE